MTNPSNNRRLEPHAPEPAALPVPDEPSAEEKQRHLLTHLPYAPWCELCVAGAGRDGQHRRKQMGENGQLETVVQADYTFFARNAQQSLVEDESTLVTVLTFVDKTSAWPLSLQVTKKGDCSQYVFNHCGTISAQPWPRKDRRPDRPRKLDQKRRKSNSKTNG